MFLIGRMLLFGASMLIIGEERGGDEVDGVEEEE